MGEEDLSSLPLIRVEDATFQVETRGSWTSSCPDVASTVPAACPLEAPRTADESFPPPPSSESGFDPASDPLAENDAAGLLSNGARIGAAEVIPLGPPTIRPPSRDEAIAPVTEERRRYFLMIPLIACTLSAAVVWLFTTGGPDACWLSDLGPFATTGSSITEAVAHRIVAAESNGDATAENELSSASGAGQFLNATWLELIRAYRPDLAGQRETEVLALRRDPELSRQMVVRLAERNAATLMERCLPVTPGTLYLSHFAGGAGAVAVLSAPESADAATTMAKADSTGRTTREMIATANPFLEGFTVADLKTWADRKMRLAGRNQLSAK